MSDRQKYSNGPVGYSGGDEDTYEGPVYDPDTTRRYEGGYLNETQEGSYYDSADRNAGGGYTTPGAAGGGYRPANPYDRQQYSGSGGYGYSADNRRGYRSAGQAQNGYRSGNSGNPYNRRQYSDAGGYGSGNGGSYRPAGQVRNGPSMASRASGQANPELYRGRQQAGYSRQPVRPTAEAYTSYAEPRRSRKRRRHHPFRNFIIFLLLLAVLVGVGYFLLFRAPEQTLADSYTRKDGFYNILLCATDEDGERTDSMMILSLDTKGKSVSLTSLPRDTLLKSGDKLNSIYINAGCGETGAEALMDTVEQLLGFRPDGYAVISYQAFKDAVDAMGGVKFDVPMDMTVDYANNDDDDVFIPAGEQVLDGDTALRVVRYRYGYSMADIQRVYVQQSFLKAMIRQCISPTKWLRLPAVYRAVMDNTITDLSGAQIRYIALWTMLSYGDGINQNTLPGEGVTYNGASCYALYSYNVVDMVNAYMNPYEEEITWDDVSIYSVSDGQLVPDQTSGTAFDASTYTYQ